MKINLFCVFLVKSLTIFKALILSKYKILIIQVITIMLIKNVYSFTFINFILVTLQ